MKCKRCGHELVDNLKFCLNCGASIKVQSDNKSKKDDTKEILDEKSKKLEIVNNKKIDEDEQAKESDVVKKQNKDDKLEVVNKRNHSIFLLLIIFIVFLVIILLCYLNINKKDDLSENTEEKFKVVFNNMKNLDNFTFDINVKMIVNYYGKDRSLDTSGSGKVDSKNNSFYMKMNYLDQNMETYGDNIHNYVYDVNDKTWIVTDYNNSNVPSFNTSNDVDFEKIDIIKIKSDKKNLNKYKFVMNMEYMSNMNSFLEELVQYDLSKFSDNVIMYVYTNKDNYIEKVYIDLTDVMNNALITENEYTFKEMSVIIEFSKFNKTGSVVVPENVINSATAYDIHNIRKNYLYNEENIMRDIVLSSTIYCKNLRIDFSNYKGELNDYLALDKYDISSISFGVITIDDTCDITIEKDFIINGKTCTYDDENYEKCI